MSITEDLSIPIYADHFCRGSQQQLITSFTQKTPKLPPVTKAGIHEHMLAIVTTCDLVSAPYFLGLALLITVGQPFRFVERPAVRGLITYLNSKVRDEDIPRKSSIASAIETKTKQLEKVTMEIIDVRILDSQHPHSCLTKL